MCTNFPTTLLIIPEFPIIGGTPESILRLVYIFAVSRSPIFASQNLFGGHPTDDHIYPVSTQNLHGLNGVRRFNSISWSMQNESTKRHNSNKKPTKYGPRSKAGIIHDLKSKKIKQSCNFVFWNTEEREQEASAVDPPKRISGEKEKSDDRGQSSCGKFVENRKPEKKPYLVQLLEWIVDKTTSIQSKYSKFEDSHKFWFDKFWRSILRMCL